MVISTPQRSKVATLSASEVESIAARVAAILSKRLDGDPADPFTWMNAGGGMCPVFVCDCGTWTENGCCVSDKFCEDAAPWIKVVAFGSHKRPAHLVRVLIHELSHAVLRWYDPLEFGEAALLPVEYAYQATENVCRAVERIFLGDFGHGWLPAHGLYWH